VSTLYVRPCTYSTPCPYGHSARFCQRSTALSCTRVFRTYSRASHYITSDCKQCISHLFKTLLCAFSVTDPRPDSGFWILNSDSYPLNNPVSFNFKIRKFRSWVLVPCSHCCRCLRHAAAVREIICTAVRYK
jgi:hypothetical protein